jgi:chromosomal replication initiator protein
MHKMPSVTEIWERALGELQLQVSKTNYNTWLKDTRGISYENDVIVVGVPNTFVAEWLTKRCYSLISKALAVITGRDIDVQFVVWQPTSSMDKPLRPDGGISTKIRKYKFNPGFTFTKFIVGDCNRLACAAATEVSEKPGCTYNPLIIYSNTGQGKSHLLHAIGHATTKKGLQVTYSSAEQFINEFVLAIRQNDMERLRNKFAVVNVFLFDDFQLLDNKKQTQQFFFHTFNELYSNNCQVVITTDRHPREMLSVSNRLRTWLQRGLVTQIQPPDFETRLAILQAKSKEKTVPISEEALQVIAHRIQDNVCQLEGALTYLDAHAKLTGVDLTPQTVTKLLTTNKSIDDRKLILQTIADYFDYPVEQLTGKKRDKETALARQIAMYLMRQEGNYSFTEISKTLGNRNHATILHGYRKIASELNANSRLKREINEIKQRIDNSY